MNSATRHIHAQNLRSASSDKFEDKEVPRSVFGGGGAYGMKHSRPPQSGQHSTSVLAALSDESSDLARFLFVGREEGGGRRTSWFRSVRNGLRGSIGESTGSHRSDDPNKKREGSDPGMKSLGTTSGCFLTMALEPMEVRNERVIMLAEAFAIFGALFLGGMWIVWEWGSVKAYGSSTNEMVNRAFEAIMAAAITCNIMLALFGSATWILALVHNGSSHDFVFDARKMLGFCSNLLMLNVKLVTCGLFLGIYSNLSPHWPETIAVMLLAASIFFVGQKRFDSLMFAINPLEVYHMPWLFKGMMFPQTVLFPSSREQLERRAKLKAQTLKERAYHERKTLDPSFTISEKCIGNLGVLLRSAAQNLGRADFDFSVVEERLNEDWFNDVDQLKGRSIEFLSRYMPWRLAEEVHKCLQLREDDTEQAISWAV